MQSYSISKKKEINPFLIKKLRGKSLKGINESWEFKLPRVSIKKPQVSILYGENGSGKSTIVSLIEFCLQGRNGSWLNKKDKDYSNLSNFLSESNGSSTVLFWDSPKIFTRSLENKRNNNNFIPDKPLPYKPFSVSPFTLRRYDIVRFVEQEAESRQVTLWEYLSSSNGQNKIKSIEDKLENLKKDYEITEIEYKQLRENLALKLNVKKEELPEADDLRIFLKKFSSFNTKDQSKRKEVKWNIIKPFENIEKTRIKLSRLKKNINKTSDLLNNPGTQIVRNKLVEEVLESASAWISKKFIENSNCTIIDKINIKLKDQKYFEIEAITNKNSEIKKFDPFRILSEANVDLLALIIYLALILESAKRNQSKLLVLDDIFQSVDKAIRLKVISLIAREFAGWEIIITTHDKTWCDSMHTIFPAHGHLSKKIEIENFNHNYGPSVKGAFNSRVEALKESLAKENIESIKAVSINLLEESLDALSIALSVRVNRKEKYTVSDLWLPIKSSLKSSSNFELKNSIQKLDEVIFLRNYALAHFNYSAIDITSSEIIEFGKRLLVFIEFFYCYSCSSYVIRKNNSMKCLCNQLIFKIK